MPSTHDESAKRSATQMSKRKFIRIVYCFSLSRYRWDRMSLLFRQDSATVREEEWAVAVRSIRAAAMTHPSKLLCRKGAGFARAYPRSNALFVDSGRPYSRV